MSPDKGPFQKESSLQTQQMFVFGGCSCFVCIVGFITHTLQLKSGMFLFELHFGGEKNQSFPHLQWFLRPGIKALEGQSEDGVNGAEAIESLCSWLRVLTKDPQNTEDTLEDFIPIPSMGRWYA